MVDLTCCTGGTAANMPIGLVSCLPGWESLLADVFRAVRCPANFPVLPLVPASPGRDRGAKILRVQKLQQALKIHREPPLELPFADGMEVAILVIPLVNNVAILISGLNHFPNLSVFPSRSPGLSRQSHFCKVQHIYPVFIIPGDTGCPDHRAGGGCWSPHWSLKSLYLLAAPFCRPAESRQPADDPGVHQQ